MFEKITSPRFKVRSPFLQQLRSRLGKIGLWLLLALVPVFFLRACVITYVPPGQIGVRQVSVGLSKGLQKEHVLPGYRRELAGFETVHTFPRDIQVVEFTNSEAETGSGHRQVSAIKVPTVDGYPVDVDVTVLYRIQDPFRVASKFGFDRKGYEQSVVINFTDPLVKQYLGELLAEQFYGSARPARVEALKKELARRFEPAGLALDD